MLIKGYLIRNVSKAGMSLNGKMVRSGLTALAVGKKLG